MPENLQSGKPWAKAMGWGGSTELCSKECTALEAGHIKRAKSTKQRKC